MTFSGDIKLSGAAAPDSSVRPVLSVSGLTVSVRSEDGEREVVSDLSFDLMG